jgi:hypothetical protein
MEDPTNPGFYRVVVNNEHLHIPGRCHFNKWAQSLARPGDIGRARIFVTNAGNAWTDEDLRERLMNFSISVSSRTIARWRSAQLPLPTNTFGCLKNVKSTDSWFRAARAGALPFIWYMTDLGAAHLSKSEFWLVDGTFWVSPNGWFQLFTVMGFDGNSFVPCAHFLLSGKDSAMYAVAFGELFGELWRLNHRAIVLKFIITDFEQAERNGFMSAWRSLPELVRNQLFREKSFRFIGCLFHFAQAVYREYRSRFREHHLEKHMALKVTAFLLWLPYFAHDDMQQLVDRLIRKLKATNQNLGCVDFLETYFFGTWIQRFSAWWRVLPGDTIVTNSAIECFHRDIKAKFKRKPLIEALARELYAFDLRKIGHNLENPNRRFDTVKNRSVRRKLATDHLDVVLGTIDRFVEDPDEVDIGVKAMTQAVAEAVQGKGGTLSPEVSAEPPASALIGRNDDEVQPEDELAMHVVGDEDMQIIVEKVDRDVTPGDPEPTGEYQEHLDSMSNWVDPGWVDRYVP